MISNAILVQLKSPIDAEMDLARSHLSVEPAQSFETGKSESYKHYCSAPLLRDGYKNN